MEGSERDTEQCNSGHEIDSDQPRENEELVPKRGVTSGCGLDIKSLT